MDTMGFQKPLEEDTRVFEILVVGHNAVLTSNQIGDTINLKEEGTHMANKKFTAREMDQLRESPYVLDVSPSIVHFSAEFKEKFWQALQSGKDPQETVQELGIDPEVLGKNRVMGLRTMVRNEVRAGKGFRDLKTYGKYLDCTLTPEAKIRLLEEELAYKDQEIEFLKKIVSLGGSPQ